MTQPDKTIIIRDNALLTEEDTDSLYVIFYGIDDEVVTDPLEGDDRTDYSPPATFHDVPPLEN
jgi:hypothetical protein